MKADNVILGSIIFFAVCLFSTLAIDNRYINVLVVFAAFMIAVTGLAYGFDKQAKEAKETKKFKYGLPL
jgi:hypothetical protein